MNKIVICGSTASGKTYLRKKLEEKGFKFNISYTSKEKRPEEIDGVHYHFVSKNYFKKGIEEGWFYEYAEYNGNYYGTGLEEWKTLSCFIMETEGIKHIKPKDRKKCFIIYLNLDRVLRETRMLKRGWNLETIKKRIKTDEEKFKNFTDYDIIITNPEF